MRTYIIIFLLLIFTSLATAGQDTEAPAFPSVELPEELARVLTDYETNYGTGGANLAAIFTEDGFVLSGGRPPIRGREAIAEYYGGGWSTCSSRNCV